MLCWSQSLAYLDEISRPGHDTGDHTPTDLVMAFCQQASCFYTCMSVTLPAVSPILAVESLKQYSCDESIGYHASPYLLRLPCVSGRVYNSYGIKGKGMKLVERTDFADYLIFQLAANALQAGAWCEPPLMHEHSEESPQSTFCLQSCLSDVGTCLCSVTDL